MTAGEAAFLELVIGALTVFALFLAYAAWRAPGK